MIVIKIGTIIIGTKIVSINQVLITIHTNPIVRNKAKCYFRQSSTFSPHGYIFIYIYFAMAIFIFTYVYIYIYVI